MIINVECLAAIGCFGGHDKIDLLGKELPQPGTDNGVVINDGNANHGLALWNGAMQ